VLRKSNIEHFMQVHLLVLETSISQNITRFHNLIVSSIISRFKEQSPQSLLLKMVRKRKILDRGMRLLQIYHVANCFEPVYVITRQCNGATKLLLNVLTVRITIKRMNMSSCIAIQNCIYQSRM